MSQETKLLLGAFTGTFAVVLAMGLRPQVRIDATASAGAARPAATTPAAAVPVTEPVPVASSQAGLMPARTRTVEPPPPAIPAPPLVEPPPGNEDYAPQNNY